MIERLYLKEYLSFSEVELNFENGLIVFTGASGTGKSILINGLLATFGLKEVHARVAEASLNLELNLEEFDIREDEPIVFKSIKKEKIRFFINNQNTSKRRVKDVSTNFIKHLNLKDLSDFENKNILNLIDIAIEDKSYKELLDSFQIDYEKFYNLKRELNQIDKNYKELRELKDFLEFEIEKIEKIEPQESEYEELLEHKRNLSKREKINENLLKANGLFEFEGVVNEVLSLSEIDSSFFDDTINELKNHFEYISDKLNELDTINIEEVLNRLEKLSSLKKKYGSIQEALIYKEEKKIELQKYGNLEENRDTLYDEVKELSEILKIKANEIHNFRLKNISLIEDRLNHYLEMLHLTNVKIELKEINLNKMGIDESQIYLNGVGLNKISLGEFNRLRLSLLATKVEFSKSEQGILILDEIDANLSGKESQSIGKVLVLLAKSYQIFSISHQPQLTSSANQHFLVEKIDSKSFVKEVTIKNRVKEIARMISGDKITKEALEFAQKMLKENS